MISFVTILGVLAVLGGSAGYFIFPIGLKFGIKSMINLAENGMVFPKYMYPEFGSISTFHLYSVTNPYEALSGEKMSFEVKGPYIFSAALVRENISFSREGELLEFASGRKLTILNDGPEFDEKMWIVNPILPSTVKTVRSMIVDRIPFKRLSEPVVFNAVNLLLDRYKERLLMLTTPREILEGRKIELLESLTNVASQFGLTSFLPPGPAENVFGLVWQQNHTMDMVELWTGTGKSQEKFADVNKFRGRSRMNIWRDKCNQISGTNGELYKPFLKQGKPIKVFLLPLCRSLYLDPVGDGAPVLIEELGIKTLEYTLSPRNFQGIRNNPRNRCYCENTKTYDCQYDGLLPVGPCMMDAPIYFTAPRFKQLDERMRNFIDWQSALENGVKYSDKQSFKIEPITGTPIQINLTLMGLVKVVRQRYMRDLANVQNLTYVPLFANTEAVTLPFKAVWQIYALQKFNDYHEQIMIATALSGAGLLALKFFFLG